MTELIVNFILVGASINVVMILLKKKLGDKPFFKNYAVFFPHLMGIACGLGYAAYYDQFLLSGALGGFLAGALATSNYDLLKTIIERKAEDV